MHRRHSQRTHNQPQRADEHKAPPGFRLSAVTFVAGIAAALVMIGANADEPDTAPPQSIGSSHVALSIGR